MDVNIPPPPFVHSIGWSGGVPHPLMYLPLTQIYTHYPAPITAADHPTPFPSREWQEQHHPLGLSSQATPTTSSGSLTTES